MLQRLFTEILPSSGLVLLIKAIKALYLMIGMAKYHFHFSKSLV